MGRAITKDKYHNNREEVEKERRRQIEEVNNQITKLNEDIEAEQAHFEGETDRNNDP